MKYYYSRDKSWYNYSMYLYLNAIVPVTAFVLSRSPVAAELILTY